MAVLQDHQVGAPRLLHGHDRPHEPGLAVLQDHAGLRGHLHGAGPGRGGAHAVGVGRQDVGAVAVGGPGATRRGGVLSMAAKVL